jgi:hypothetical protein
MPSCTDCFTFLGISIAPEKTKFMIGVPYDSIYKIHYFANGVVNFNYRCFFSHGVVSTFCSLNHGIVVYANFGTGSLFISWSSSLAGGLFITL